MKVCNRCELPKPLEAFGVRTASRDGRNTVCKPCNVARVRESERRHPETKSRWERDNIAIRRIQKRDHMRRVRAAAQKETA